MQTIKIFLASSAELDADKEQLELFISWKKPAESFFLKDLDELEKARITHPDIAKIRKLLTE